MPARDPAPPAEAPFTREEALAFIASLRAPLIQRTGFRWMAARLARLSAYVEALADENERLKAALGEPRGSIPSPENSPE